MIATSPKEAVPANASTAGAAERVLFRASAGDGAGPSSAVGGLAPRRSVLGASALDRLVVALGLAGGLWLAVAWALDAL